MNKDKQELIPQKYAKIIREDYENLSDNKLQNLGKNRLVSRNIQLPKFESRRNII